MRSKVILDGKARIYEDGRLFKILPSGREKEVQISAKTYKARYASVSVLGSDGKLKKLYVHRLVAQTFMPVSNPDSMEVHHKDGNPRNNSIENLEWLDRKTHAAIERKNKSVKYEKGYKCPNCGMLISDNCHGSKLCARCQKELKYKEHLRKKAASRAGKVSRRVVRALPERERFVVNAWLAGYTYKAIGQHYGISKQAVHQMIQRIIEKFQDPAA